MILPQVKGQVPLLARGVGGSPHLSWATLLGFGNIAWVCWPRKSVNCRPTVLVLEALKMWEAALASHPDMEECDQRKSGKSLVEPKGNRLKLLD